MGLFNHLKNRLQDLSLNDNNNRKETQPPVPSRDYEANQSQQQQQQQQQNAVSNQGSTSSDDIFGTPISTSAPPSQITSSNVHPVPLPSFYKQDGPIETNNFYGNLLVDTQVLPVWTHPYSVWNCADNLFKGLAISQTSVSQRVFGDKPTDNPCKYFFSPVGICSVVIGAAEFQDGYDFKVGECTRFSCGLRYQVKGDSNRRMSSYLVQGMGMITGIYQGSITPRLASKVGFKSFDKKSTLSNGLNKYLITLFDSNKWVVYSTVDSWKLENSNTIVAGTINANNTIVQVAKIPKNGNESTYDNAAGSYVTGMNLTGTADDNNATYNFNYTLAGKSASNKAFQYFLPHQVDSADSSMASQLVSGAELDSTCKGSMKAYLTNKFVMNEAIPLKYLLYDPYRVGVDPHAYSSDALAKIKTVATTEINKFDVVNSSNTDSMYTSGKILDKGAYMLYVAAFVLKDEALAKKQLAKMKEAFSRFINNKQQAPLVYNNTWKGIVSSGGLSDGNFYVDYGNCFYNDHHFHYGYHIHAAALVVLADKKYGDGTFLSTCKDWVNALLRDICNPSSKDTYFPVFRSFDFFNGHCFANGLFAHGDGKDEESSSEDYHCFYGIKMWAKVTENKQLEKIASLILAIERRAMNIYMLYQSDNKVMPSNFIGNKVSGILFENKIDHATYFGLNKEYIHGIHMIPITPVSNYIRGEKFVKEEWDDMKLGDLVNSIDGGWKGLLRLNSAIIDPTGAWKFFSSDSFQDSWLDNGMSRTWSLTYCAGMGGD